MFATSPLVSNKAMDGSRPNWFRSVHPSDLLMCNQPPHPQTPAHTRSLRKGRCPDLPPPLPSQGRRKYPHPSPGSSSSSKRKTRAGPWALVRQGLLPQEEGEGSVPGAEGVTRGSRAQRSAGPERLGLGAEDSDPWEAGRGSRPAMETLGGAPLRRGFRGQRGLPPQRRSRARGRQQM